MKNKVRIGKDFTIRWAVVTSEGEPYAINADAAILRIYSPYGAKDAIGFIVSGNIIEWVFKGKDQKHLGDYTIELVENNGQDGMVSVDFVEAFTLVAHTNEESLNDEGAVEIQTIELTSQIALVSAGGGYYDDTEIREGIADLQQKDNAIEQELTELSAEVGKKQNAITDLNAIREGASKGATALQSIPSEYVTETELANKNFATTSSLNSKADKSSLAAVATSGSYNDLSGKPTIPAAVTESVVSGWGFTKNTGTITGITMNGVSKGTSGVVNLGKVITEHQDISGKVDKVSGKQLSTEDFTSVLKAKLEGLSNYDDTTLANAISGLETRLNTLVSGDVSTAIESFNEIMAFLDGVKDTQDLQGIIAAIEQQIASKQDKINDLETIRSGAAKGATSIQKVKTINGQSIEGEGDLVIEAGGGLKYSIERTVYLTKMDLFGEIEDTFEITEEQREYNRETVRLASDNEMPVTLNKGGQIFAPYTSGSSEARFIASYVDETETWSFTIFINDNGNAEGACKVIPMGATKEELATKQDAISDLDAIRSGAAKGATAIQSVKTINGNSIVGEGDITIQADVDTSAFATKEELNALQTEVINNEEVTAAAINDLNTRIGAAADTAYVDNAIASAITLTLNTEV